MATSNELSERVATEHGLTKTQAKAIVDTLLQGIADASVGGEEVSLPGFGKFKVKTSPERVGRNPSTGAEMKIAAARKVTFTPAKAFKDALNK